MNVFRKLWRGEYSLPLALWGFYCAGLFAAFLISGFILAGSRLVDARPLGFIVGFALLCLYWLVATVGVWRSARRYWVSPIWMDRIWAATARILILIWSGGAVLRMIDGGAQGVMLRAIGGMDF
jgi:hypothetical protein